MATTGTKKRKKGRKLPMILGAVAVLLIGTALAFVLTAEKPPARKKATTISITLPPPPPPPTPPPPTPPPEPPKPEEKMIEQEPVKEEPKPEEPPPEPEPALGTSIKGDGPDAFGLSGNGNGRIGGVGGNGSGNRSKWGWYAGQVQSLVVERLRAHKLTRSASLTLTVRVWADSTGRIVRATLAGSSGSAATDTAIRNEILTGLQLKDAPPEGMPMPIVMRITARRP